MKRLVLALLVAVSSLLLSTAPTHASIYVIDQGYSHSMINNAKSHLTNLGYTVVSGGTLANYTPYEQVWDLRYQSALGAADITAMGSYLTGGGRLYLTGEHSYFDTTRNTSLVNLISNVGGGSMSLADTGVSGYQPITVAGAVVNNPNVFTSVYYGTARTTSSSGNGFLVTETSAGSSRGSLVGWDFGDIAGASSARMLVAFDIEIFLPQNGQNWTENMATFLGADNAVPEPTTLAIWSTLGSLGLIVARRRRRRLT